METSRLRKRMPVTALTDPKIVWPAIGSAFATALAKSGIPAVIANRRGPASLRDRVAGLGPAIRGGTREDAAAQDIVLVAVKGSKLPAALALRTGGRRRARRRAIARAGPARLMPRNLERRLRAFR